MVNNVSEQTKALIRQIAAAHILRDAHPELLQMLAKGNASEEEVVPHLVQYLQTLHGHLRNGSGSSSPSPSGGNAKDGGSTARRALQMMKDFDASGSR